MLKRSITYGLLLLVLLALWHNSSFHVHPEDLAGKDHVHHDHIYDHETGHHHHGSTHLHLLDLIRNLLGDFKHADPGPDHLELLPNTQSRVTALDIFEIVPVKVFLLSIQSYPLLTGNADRRGLSAYIVSCLDPPLIDSKSQRGPPFLS